MELSPITGTSGECAFLYQLLEERPAEANISHKAMPTYDAHCAFVASRPYSAWYLVVDGGLSVGAIYLSRLDEIGIAISREMQGRGYAQVAIIELMEKHPRKRYLANVAPGNEASHKLFGRMGKVIQSTYEVLPC